MKNLLILTAVVAILTSCGILKDEPKPKTTATVVTDEVSNITATGATVAGEVVIDGNSTVTERGVAYGTSMNPTIDGGKVAAGAGTGLFTAQLTGLTAGTTYHARAYAVNSKGVGYGADRSFSTDIAIPTLTTTAATAITAVAASTGGTISSDGGVTITARGVCWNTTGTPTTADNKTSDGTGKGSFTSSLTGLRSNTKIYIRAYATNNNGTAYGNQIELTTLKVVPANGLVGWWPFNGNANDESGNGNNGVIDSAVPTTSRLGEISNGYRFDGVKGAITIENPPIDPGQNEYSIGFWFRLDDLSKSLQIFLNTVPHNSLGFGFNGYHAPSEAYMLIGDGFSWLNEGNWTKPSGVTYANNLWSHFLVTKSGTEYKLYFDGKLSNTVTLSQVPSVKIKLALGSFGGSPNSEVLKGALDDFAIFNRALTADEVLKIYNGTGF